MKCIFCKTKAEGILLHKGKYVDVCWDCALEKMKQRTWEQKDSNHE